LTTGVGSAAVYTGTYQLSSTTNSSITVSTTSNGTLANAGLTAGTYSANVSSMTSIDRSVAATTTAPSTGTTGLLNAGTLRINGTSIVAASSLDDTASDTTATSSTKAASAIAIAAALEVGIRRGAVENKKEIIRNSKDVANYLKAQLQFKSHEVFIAIFLNQANKILHNEMLSEGGITGTVVDPRILLRKALEHNAVSIILCHNHPSGNLNPSQADKQLTNKIKDAAKLLDITVADHIIVSSEGYFSFADEGLI
jgi:DNA repair protein RadC